MWVRASGVCAHFPCCSMSVQVLMLWAVSRVVRRCVVELSWMRRLVGYTQGVHVQDV